MLYSFFFFHYRSYLFFFFKILTLSVILLVVDNTPVTGSKKISMLLPWSQLHLGRISVSCHRFFIRYEIKYYNRLILNEILILVRSEQMVAGYGNLSTQDKFLYPAKATLFHSLKQNRIFFK